MKVDGKHTRSIWLEPDGWSVGVIDQTMLPHRFVTLRLTTLDEAAHAIRSHADARRAADRRDGGLRHLPCACRADASDEALERAYATLLATRPTAINLKWALDEMVAVAAQPPARGACRGRLPRGRPRSADEDVAINRAIGRHGLTLIEAIAARKKPGEPVNVLTHCNAGWLATVDVGTATAPIYTAHDKGMPVHVWVDETRPRNQGASLTAWELGQHGVPHTVIPDNTGGHLMQHGMVDIAIVGTDRVDRPTATSATRSAPISRRWRRSDNGVPFYVALPSPTIDFTVVGRRCRNSDRAARGRRGRDHDRAAPPTAASRRCGSCRTGRRSPTTAST